MIELIKLIDVIVGFASPVVQNKLQRNELVIKLLKQLNLDPDHPPTDFTAVYQYTLVEYGIGKPKPVLEIFRQLEIQAIFRKALDRNNSALLLQEGERFLSSHALGEQIRELGIDAKREFYQFAAIFIEVAKRTRTPAEVLTNQRLESLHQQIGTVQERLTRLPTLEGMRTEMARLAAQSLALPAAESQDQQCRAFALAQQMKGWFETLGYRFETHEVWQNDYFEWVINIPVRRGRYDRILVRGMEGAAEIGDVGMLRQSVEQQRTDEGWLVTTRRISRSARTEVEKPENAHLGCYTFDELLDQDADFSGYLSWLEAEIQQRQIEQKYVPLACTKEELDPVTQQRIAVSRYDDRDGWIDGYIDQWLDDPAKEHISVLGEFGTGKTWFALHYAWVALQRYRDAQKRGVDRPRLPLVIPLRDYAKAVSVESLFSEFFFRKHEIPIPGYSAFEQLNRMGKLLLIFDGFDEMAARVDRQEMINNFWELAKIVVPGAKVILTCRTEHFPEVKEGRALLNAELKASTINLNEDTPQFEVLELEKFDDEQIRQVLTLQASPEVVQQVMNNAQLLDLARRPVMTELILEALPDIEAGKPVDMSRVYLYAVRRKMERDIKEERTFTSLADKLYFLCELSWEMLSSDRMSLNYREFPDRIRRLFGSVVQEEKDLDHWHYDMMGQTMLIRNADGDYMPAHRSLLEFFAAYKFAAELGILSPDFLELAQAKSCLDTSAESQDYTWSTYFQRELDETGRSIAITPLKEFVSEDLERLRLGFGKAPLTKAVIDLLLPMLTFSLSSSSLLLKVIEITQGRTKNEAGYVGGNTATLLIKLNSNALENTRLPETVIIGADFSEASLRGSNFTGAYFAETKFLKAIGIVWSVTFSPDGRLMATSDDSGLITIWETNSLREIWNSKEHGNSVYSVTFSPDGQLLASASSDQTIKLWSISSGKCVKTLRGHSNSAISVTFSPSGELVASTSYDCTIILWNVHTGDCLNSLHGHTDWIYSSSFSPDGEMLASSSRDQTVRLWDLKTGKCIKILRGHLGLVNSAPFSPSSKILISAGYDQTIMLWDTQTDECLRVFKGHTGSIWTLAFSLDGQMIASGASDCSVRLWDVKTGECIRILEEHTSGLRSVVFNSDGKTLASSSSDQTVRLWDIHTGECLKVLRGYSNPTKLIAFISKNTIVNVNYDGTAKLWDITTGKYLRTLHKFPSFAHSIAYDPKALTFASADEDVKLWSLQTGECLKTFQEPRSSYAVCFSPDSQILAGGSSGNMIKLWNTLTGECLSTLSGHTNRVSSLAFSPDGKLLASASYDKTARLWNPLTGDSLMVLQNHSNSVSSVTFSPDGQVLATASYDKTVKLWNSHTGECISTLEEHTNWVTSISFSPDGQVLASCSCDQTIKLWNIKTGRCVYTLQGHRSSVDSVIFSPDSQFLLSGSDDGTIKVWDIRTAQCLHTLTDRPYEGMNITGVKGLTEAEAATLKALGAIEH